MSMSPPVSLRPYDGGSLPMPANAGKSFDRYGVDQSGRVTYSFNGLGFRSEEYAPRAARHIFVAGCSHSFGLGIPLAQSWPNCFRALYCQRHGLREEQVNLLNFSSVGASNRYITRTILAQCERRRPDLALVQLTHKNRMENVIEGRGFNILPTILRSDNRATFSMGETQEVLFTRLREAARSYYGFYTDEFGGMELLLNLLLVQRYFAHRQIPCVFLCIDPLPEVPLLRPLVEMVDHSCLKTLPGPIFECLEDVGTVDLHPGARTSARLAAELFEVYQRVQGGSPGVSA